MVAWEALGGAALLVAAGELFQAAALGAGEIVVAVLVVVFFVVVSVRGDGALGDRDAGLRTRGDR